MFFKILGLVLVLIGAVICYGQKAVFSKVLHKDDPTDQEILRMKILGLTIAALGAVTIFVFK